MIIDHNQYLHYARGGQVFHSFDQVYFHYISLMIHLFLCRQLALERDIQGTCQSAGNDGCQIILQSNTKTSTGRCLISNSDLHESLISVCGILLPKLSPVTTGSENTAAVKTVVAVESMLSALQNVAMAVSSCEPVIVSGHVGAGKTCLVEYLAQLTGRHQTLIKVSKIQSTVS